jgi:hypothetical protein
MGVVLDRGNETNHGRRELPASRLQDATFALGKAGQIESGEFLEVAFDGVEAGLDLARAGTEGRGAGRRGIGSAAWIAQQALARGRVGGAPGGEERPGLARAETVLLDRIGETPLLGRREGAKGVGRAGGEQIRVEASDELGRELASQDEAAFDPAATVAEELADGRRGEAVIVGEGADDARLVHGAGGAARGVGLEEQGLGRDPGGILDHGGDAMEALGFPGGEPLVAVDEVEDAVADGRDADRHRGEERGPVGASAAQRGERRAQGVDGDLDDAGHGRWSSTGSSWKRG